MRVLFLSEDGTMSERLPRNNHLYIVTDLSKEGAGDKTEYIIHYRKRTEEE